MTSRTQWTLFVCCLVLLEISAAAVHIRLAPHSGGVHVGASRSKGNWSSVLEAPSYSELRRAVREQQGLLLTLQSAVLGLQSTVVQLQSSVVELQSSVVELQSSVVELQSSASQHSPDTSTSGATSTEAPVRMSGSGGAIYVRWGRTSCPADVELVYKGYAGGSFWTHTGAAVDYLCLPEDPQYANYTGLQSGHVNYVYGAEYESFNRLPNFQNQDQDVPCAVCRIPTRSTVLMIPAKTSCHPGYHLEYFGYLMAGPYDHNAASQFVCVDGHPESLEGGLPDHNGKLFYFVESRCGALPCPPYVEGSELTCVVCSK